VNCEKFAAERNLERDASSAFNQGGRFRPPFFYEPITMPSVISIESFLEQSKTHLLLDVRSPAEFERGRIASAVNLPLFDNRERAIVGTTYQQLGRQPAILAGLELAGPKMSSIVETTWTLSNQNGRDRRVFVYCWRGGMRSRSVGWLLEQSGLEVALLNGGYKSYRRYVLNSFCRPLRLLVLSGLTGSGKTYLLGMLRQSGEQVIDLEQLAKHRGSAFGGIGLEPQPTVEQFENSLFEDLDVLDKHRRIWIEDEGRQIGSVNVPNVFFEQLRSAPAVFLEVDRYRRIDIILEEYGCLPKNKITESIHRITKRMGGQNVVAACRALDRGDLRCCVNILLDYYDKTYLAAKSRIPRAIFFNLPIDNPMDPRSVSALHSVANDLVR
jgi:tRNA 2-selenouridine synthase